MLLPGLVQVAGLNAEHPTELTLNGVEVRGITAAQAKARFTKVTIGPMGTNFTLTGQDVSTVPDTKPARLTISCDGKFLPYQD